MREETEDEQVLEADDVRASDLIQDGAVEETELEEELADGED